MPLPPPPAKLAARLAREAFEDSIALDEMQQATPASASVRSAPSPSGQGEGKKPRRQAAALLSASSPASAAPQPASQPASQAAPQNHPEAARATAAQVGSEAVAASGVAAESVATAQTGAQWQPVQGKAKFNANSNTRTAKSGRSRGQDRTPSLDAPSSPPTPQRTAPAQAGAPDASHTWPRPEQEPLFPAHAGKWRKRDNVKKLFVLDTNVLMHDPTSLFRFEEHDVFLPMTTLEELDRNKKGLSEVARNARQASRAIEALIAGQHGDRAAAVSAGIALSSTGHKEARGRLFFQTKDVSDKLPEGLWAGLGDNRILLVVRSLAEPWKPTPVVLVSKDINMRIKAHALGLLAEDYFNDKVLEDTDVLASGMLELPANFWDKHARAVDSWKEQNRVYYRCKSSLVKQMHVNQFVFLDAPEGGQSLQAIVHDVQDQTATLQVLRDYCGGKHGVWGIHARNKEQNFAFNLLLDPELDLVTLAGQAGTGKTLLALAAGLHQVLETKLYNEIIITRVTVPIGEDIGFLPGSEEEKMSPWMGALDDNLEVLLGAEHEGGEWGRAASSDLVRSRIRIKSLNFMRGRTFLQKFVIIDEAQNLTPKQMKALITRAGPGSKIVCLGNIAQIDTPYLTEGSSGLTYLVDRMRGWRHSGHITLARGERSRLADFASEAL